MTQESLLLAIDVGNSNTVFGLCRLDPAISMEQSVVRTWRVATRGERMGDDWFVTLDALLDTEQFDRRQIVSIVIGSVVPAATPRIEDMCRRHLGLAPIVVSARLDLGIRVTTEQPLATGADRIANAVAARELVGAPCIVVDIGTATNVEVLDPAGDFIGGAIAPGPGLLMEALTSRAAQLQPIPLEFPPTTGIGRGTAAALQSGSVAGYLDLVEGIVRRIRNELGTDAPVLVTGGRAPQFVAESAVLNRYEPALTLYGLRAIAMRSMAVDAGSTSTPRPQV
ncbi:MAG TPA: type III pantothenate kinase [Thermomicrobiales bacterium]|jgi:type III pantothenate kinase|nr:type III pantothenate kinase [Thermomicrobiales bacterium]